MRCLEAKDLVEVDRNLCGGSQSNLVALGWGRFGAVGCLNSGMAHLGSHLADNVIPRRCNREYQGEADDLKSHSGVDYLENTQRTSEEKTQFGFSSVDAVAQCKRLKGGRWWDVGCTLVASGFLPGHTRHGNLQTRGFIDSARPNA